MIEVLEQPVTRRVRIRYGGPDEIYSETGEIPNRLNSRSLGSEPRIIPS